MPPRATSDALDREPPTTGSAAPIAIALTGHLTREALDRALGPASTALRASSRRVALVVDALEMTGYEGDARQRFVEWNTTFRAQIRAVAIVTDKRLWHMVIAAMALASGQQMKGFATQREALAWLEL